MLQRTFGACGLSLPRSHSTFGSSGWFLPTKKSPFHGRPQKGDQYQHNSTVLLVSYVIVCCWMAKYKTQKVQKTPTKQIKGRLTYIRSIKITLPSCARRSGRRRRLPWCRSAFPSGQRARRSGADSSGEPFRSERRRRCTCSGWKQHR